MGFRARASLSGVIFSGILGDETGAVEPYGAQKGLSELCGLSANCRVYMEHSIGFIRLIGLKVSYEAGTCRELQPSF